MEPTDFTFAMLAKAIAAAGGAVHITAQEILRMNAAYAIDMKDDGYGGQILTLVERPHSLDEILIREPQDEAR
jgi:hypothetical protein